MKRYFPLIILLYALVIGLLAIDILPDLNYSDAQTYDGIARNITEQGRFIEVHEQITPPLYPVFLSSLYALFGRDFAVVYLVQFLILGLIGLLAMKLSKRYLSLNDASALLAGLLIVSWPYFIIFAKQVLTETLYTFFLMSIVLFLCGFTAKPDRKKALALGVLFALAAHTRPVILFLPFWLLGWNLILLYFRRRQNKTAADLKNIFRHGLIAAGIFLLLITPYSVYGSLKAGQFVPIASNIKTINHRANISMDKEWYLYGTPGYEPGSEITWQKFVVVKLKNIYRFWDSGADGGRAATVGQAYPAVKYLMYLYHFGYYLVVLLFFASLYFIKKNKYIMMFWLVVLYFWGLHTALFPFPRYTLPIMPLVIILAGYSLASLFKAFKNSRSLAGRAGQEPAGGQGDQIK